MSDKHTNPAVPNSGETKPGEPQPWQHAIFGDIQNRVQSILEDDFIGTLADPEKFAHEIEHNRDRVIATVYELGNKSIREAKNIKKSIDAGDPIEKIRLKIEEIVAPDIKPEEDPELAVALNKNEPKENEEEGDKQTRWQKLLKQIATLNHPLYRRIAGFLTNSSVKRLGLSPDTIFKELQDRSKRPALLRRLAEARFELVIRNPDNVTERKQALEDLQAILYHSQYLLRPNERGEFIELYSRVGGALATVKIEEGLYDSEEPVDENEENQKAITQSQDILEFIRDEKGKEHKISGEKGLRDRLSTKGNNYDEKPNAFGLVGKELRDGGFIDTLPISESLKHTCTIIALEEVAILLRMIGYGKHETSESLSTLVKMKILSVFRRNARGLQTYENASTTIKNETTVQAIKDFDVLRAKIEKEDKPRKSDVDELLVLYSWLSFNTKFDPDHKIEETLDVWQKNSEMSVAELEEEAIQARKHLKESLTEASPIRAEVLEDANMDVLLEALADLQEEKALAMRAELLSNRISTKLTEKELHKIKREPKVLHEACEAEYIRKEEQIRKELLEQNVAPSAINMHPRVKELDEDHEKERAMREKIEDGLREELEEAVLDVFEAEIHLRTAREKEKYEQYLKPAVEKRFQEMQDKGEDVSEKYIWDLMLPPEMSTMRYLDNLIKCDLSNSINPYATIKDLLADLKGREEVFNNPEDEIKSYEININRAQENAKMPLKNDRISKALNPETRKTLEGQADSTSRPGSDAQRGLEEFASDPRNLFIAEIAEKNRKKIDSFVEGMEGIIEEVSSVKLREAGAPQYAWGAFSREKGNEKILLNKEKIAYYAKEAGKSYDEIKNIILTEEFAHARNYKIRELIGADYFLETFDEASKIEGFEERARAWVRDENMTREQWQLEVADELLAKLTLYRAHKHLIKINNDDGTCEIPIYVPLKVEDVLLFEKMSHIKLLVTDAELSRLAPGRHVAYVNKLALADGDEDLQALLEEQGQQSASGGTSQPEQVDTNPDVPDGYSEGSQTARDITDTKNGFTRIRGFFKAYPGQATADNVSYIDELEKLFEEKYGEYKKDPHADTNDVLTGQLTRIRVMVEEAGGAIAKFDAEQRDLRNEQQTGRGIASTLWHSFNLMSISDFVAIYKGIKEDLVRQFGRRQQGKIGEVGESLTSWIPKKVPYLGTLSAEFHRRYKQAEVDEVQKWQDALKDVDSYELQEKLHNPANKDQMKAILNLLSEKGRIDWTDDKFWMALNKLSVFSMPIEQCKRDENLREDWLRKLMTDIYEDKEHYRDWKNKNDGGVKSGKGNFTPEADRLSNMSGPSGLAGSLNKQLRMFVEAKRKGEPIPDDVHPHLYEEIIHYAMRNGKMGMEEKFYYLVQGIAHGLLNADRLRTLAGQEGEILNIFPFIDYFYGRNNSMPEIIALADRLRETTNENSADYYKPGIRTTMWLELEVAREPRVQERLRKGVDKKAGDMDHDDMHFFIPRLDSQAIKSMASPRGGGTQKMSTDGWRNAYTGYNGFFKSLGILSKLQDDKKENAKFSSEDVYNTIRGITGFIQMDGILTVRSNYKDTEGRRPSIPYGEMKNTFAVASNHKDSVYKYRGKANDFVKAVLEKYRDEKHITREDIDLVLYDTEKNDTPDQETQDKIHYATNRLQANLTNAIKTQGTKELKQILIEHMPKFIAPTSDAENYEYSNAEEIWDKFQQHSA